jgi:hypothetical protein
MSPLVLRPFAWLVRRIGAPTLLSLTLLCVALGSVALGLADLVRGLDRDLPLRVAILGVLLGWLLAKSPFPGWLGTIVGFVLGAEGLVIHVGHLSRPLTSLLRSTAALPWEVLRWLREGSFDPPPFTPALEEVGTGLNSLLTRVGEWSQAVARGEAAFDAQPTTLVWSLVLWMTAIWAGWVVRRRHQSLHAIAPAGTPCHRPGRHTIGDRPLIYV